MRLTALAEQSVSQPEDADGAGQHGRVLGGAIPLPRQQGRDLLIRLAFLGQRQDLLLHLRGTGPPRQRAHRHRQLGRRRLPASPDNLFFERTSTMSAPIGAVSGSSFVVVLPSSRWVRRRGRANARPIGGFSSWSAGRPEPPGFPPARPRAVTPCACPDVKADATGCPRGCRSGPPGPPRACPRPTPPPGCTSTGRG